MSEKIELFKGCKVILIRLFYYCCGFSSFKIWMCTCVYLILETTDCPKICLHITFHAINFKSFIYVFCYFWVPVSRNILSQSRRYFSKSNHYIKSHLVLLYRVAHFELLKCLKFKYPVARSIYGNNFSSYVLALY